MLIYMMMVDSPEDQSKFEKIYLTYKGLMYHIAYKVLNNEEDAEDAVQNAFVKISENISKIGDPVCPKTQVYVVTIVENKAIDLYRANQRRSKVMYLDEISGTSIEEGKVYGLAACMAKLPPRYRQVILLKYYQGFSCREIAKQLNITEANAINENVYIEGVNYSKEVASVNGIPAEIYMSQNENETNSIIWNDDSGVILFTASGNFDQETLIRIAENIEKK